MPETLPDKQSASDPATPDFADLARTEAPGWWRYPLGVVAIVGSGLGMITVLAAIVGAAAPETLRLMQDGVDDWMTVDLASAAGAFALFMSTIILFLPITLITVRVIHRRPWRGVLTGRGHFSWRLLAISFATAMAFGVVIIVAGLLAFPDEYELRFDASRTLAFLPLFLLLIPLQSAAEEVVFRGYILQAVGRVTRLAWVRLLVPAALFFALHLPNPEALDGGLPALLGYAVISFYLGLLALRGSGLEAAIGLHVANNVIAIAIVSTGASSHLAYGIIHLPDPMYWASLATTLILCGLHWLVMRRVFAAERRRNGA